MIRKRRHKREYEIPGLLGDVKPIIRIGGRDKTTRRRWVPNINMSFGFDGGTEEYFLNVNDRAVIGGDPAPSLAGGVLRSDSDDRTTRFYINDDGGLEHEIVLPDKPDSRRIDLQIRCSPALSFYHQPALRAAEIAAGRHRPDDIINSYAVYCDAVNNKYRNGKLCHIKRSFVIDRHGNKTWCKQGITVNDGAGLWSIVIPKKIWRDESLYPLTVGPTMGYTTQGGSTDSCESYVQGLLSETMSEDGTVNSIKAYMRCTTLAHNAKAAIFTSSDRAMITNGESDEESVAVGNDQLITFTFTTAPSLSDGTAYDICVHGESTTGYIYSYYDTGVSGDGGRDYSSYGTGFPDPWVPTSNTRLYSHWIDYTASGGPTYTLTAEAGSLVLTGTDADLLFDRRISAEAGSVALTGAPAGLLFDRRITADAGACAITGTDADLLYSRILAAESGSISLTGTDADLLFNRRLLADGGTITLTGFDVILTYTPLGGPTYTLTADAGSLVLTGHDADLRFNRVLSADGGSIALTGTDANLLFNRMLLAESGSITITGTDADLLRGYRLDAEAGTLVLTGTAATLTYSGASAVQGVVTVSISAAKPGLQITASKPGITIN